MELVLLRTKRMTERRQIWCSNNRLSDCLLLLHGGVLSQVLEPSTVFINVSCCLCLWCLRLSYITLVFALKFWNFPSALLNDVKSLKNTESQPLWVNSTFSKCHTSATCSSIVNKSMRQSVTTIASTQFNYHWCAKKSTIQCTSVCTEWKRNILERLF